jgi:hypothetical protein
VRLSGNTYDFQEMPMTFKKLKEISGNVRKPGWYNNQMLSFCLNQQFIMVKGQLSP